MNKYYHCKECGSEHVGVDYNKTFDLADVLVSDRIVFYSSLIEDIEDMETVQLKLNNNIIQLLYKKDDLFIKRVKQLNFRWMEYSYWGSQYTSINDLKNKLIELSVKFLGYGYAIEYPDNLWDIVSKEKLTEYIESCHYIPTNNRQVTLASSTSSCFSVTMPFNDSCFDDFKKIRGAIYQLGAILIPVDKWKKVLELINLYQFMLDSNSFDHIAKQYKKETAPVQKLKVQVEKFNKLKEDMDDLFDDEGI